MSGEPLNRSKAAMRWALQHLDPDDTFQIIRFSESALALRTGTPARHAGEHSSAACRTSTV